jgi:hypothetical protein
MGERSDAVEVKVAMVVEDVGEAGIEGHRRHGSKS